MSMSRSEAPKIQGRLISHWARWDIIAWLCPKCGEESWDDTWTEDVNRCHRCSYRVAAQPEAIPDEQARQE